MAGNGILVTGGTGLVGAYTTARLLNASVRTVAYDLRPDRRLLQAVGVDLNELSLVEGDVLDFSRLQFVVREYQIGRIIHLAAALGEQAQRQPYAGAELNIMGTVNVLEAARLEGISRVVYGSSGAVYLGSLDERTKNIDESIPLNPTSLYAATKASAELLGRSYARSFGFEFISVRYVGGLYGPSPVAKKSTREQAIQDMVRAAIRGRSTTVQWPEGTMELLYGKDAAKGTVSACLTERLKDDVFHIGSGELLDGDDFVRALEHQFPKVRITLKQVTRPLPHPEIGLLNDNSRSCQQLGYQPDYPLGKALEDYAATLRIMEPSRR
ncbi:MAG: NAD-dependent epimerase/dehydratase family protein [Deltaproteobacteria bacterium]|nr:NAD-dependent epimerase/dehydratase family protein [Deltaproteobacteria bacterium]